MCWTICMWLTRSVVKRRHGWEAVFELLAAMGPAGAAANETTCNSAITALERGRHWREALQVFSSMPSLRRPMGRGFGVLASGGLVHPSRRHDMMLLIGSLFPKFAPVLAGGWAFRVYYMCL